jgi:antitoxin (DNA-binding transcriptional repressor) of toxin-antitoxin stability system
MTEVALYEAKNRLSELIERVQRGEVIAITRRGKVVAQLALHDRPHVISLHGVS